MIAPGLRDLALPIEKLTLLPGNPRRGDVDAIARSLERFGQRKPVVVNNDGTVIAGNHTVMAARQLGWDEVAAVEVDDDPITAQAFALADNRTGDLGTYDDADLLAMLQAVAEHEDLLIATAYTPEDLLALLDSGTEDGETRGMLLAQAAAVVGEPSVLPERHSRWHLGEHLLVVADLLSEHHLWRDELDDGVVFCPYPGPMVTVASALRGRRLLLVQPDRYLAGHILDMHASLFGAEEVRAA